MSKKAKGSLPYDRTDRESVYYYAIVLRGSTRHVNTTTRQSAIKSRQ